MAKECTEPRNMANVQCRNCDEMGHESKGCPKPRDSKYRFIEMVFQIDLLKCCSVARQVHELPADGPLQVSLPQPSH